MKKTILLAIILVSLAYFGSSAVQAASCSGTCYPTVCPEGTSSGTGTCTDSNYVCCSGTATNQETGSTSSSNSSTTSSTTSTYTNPITSTTMEGVLSNIYTYLTTYVVGPLAVIFIVIGGIMYMLSGGNKEAAERAKKTIIYAITGLAIVILSSYFYNEIKTILDGSSTSSQLQTILSNVLKFLLSIVGFLAIIAMVVGSIWMFTAAGNEERYELGKKTAGYAILGLAIAVASLIIAQQVGNLISGSS